MNIILGVSASKPIGIDEVLELVLPLRGNALTSSATWGLVAHEGRAARVFKDGVSTGKPTFFTVAMDRELRSHSYVVQRSFRGHQSTPSHGDITPFERELRGRSWVFANDGDLQKVPQLELCGFYPLGDSKAERAFCLLLNAIREYVSEDGEVRYPDQMIDRIARITTSINAYGGFNYILSNGSYVVAHSHTQLHLLSLRDASDAKLRNACLVASQELTDDDHWSCLPPNSLTLIRDGSIIDQKRTGNPASPAAWQEHERGAQHVAENRRAFATERARFQAQTRGVEFESG
ncbi:hypothetical protein ASD00_31055 [Ensifer sp. Root31]|uniref:class II glutamine amidotransferase n=1 Tax=Ensifer sp. Root31 TaxID=1736512 RepID=UPI000708ABAF|nr:class II glutamine amidotransferase [Ensifer sp. Root31]KQU86337.1 hypothetical protein ASD00_31055 [Ensifer sp. Root31]